MADDAPDGTKPNPAHDADGKRQQRLSRAKAFLEAGRGVVDVAPALSPEARKAQAKPTATPEKDKPLDPTRYGDWEKNGRCIDF